LRGQYYSTARRLDQYEFTNKNLKINSACRNGLQ
jgi:hypothetical protein